MEKPDPVVLAEQAHDRATTDSLIEQRAADKRLHRRVLDAWRDPVIYHAALASYLPYYNDRTALANLAVALIEARPDQPGAVDKAADVLLQVPTAMLRAYLTDRDPPQYTNGPVDSQGGHHD